MIDGLIARIEREAGVSNLLEVLTERLGPNDLQSLLLEVYSRLAGAGSARRLLEQYETNRFVAPSALDPRLLVEIDRLAWTLLPEAYVPVELAPLCPLGTNSLVATVSQHKVVSTIRNTEVVADTTNVLALECAIRRRRLMRVASRRREPVLLAASQRVTRAQVFKGARYSAAHFRLLSLCAAGRDEGSYRFESQQLVEQIAFHVRLLQNAAQCNCPWRQIRVAITDLTEGRLHATLDEQVRRPLSDRFPDVRCHFDPDRTSGRGYYDGVCFKISATDSSDCELELGDGGVTKWTRDLLSDQKERLIVSGLGIERLCAGTLAAEDQSS
jgi:hypothetical protein